MQNIKEIFFLDICNSNQDKKKYRFSSINFNIFKKQFINKLLDKAKSYVLISYSHLSISF